MPTWIASRDWMARPTQLSHSTPNKPVSVPVRPMLPWHRAKIWGPLHGLPLTVKDSFAVAGMPTTAGATRLRSYYPTSSAAAVQRYVDAGAIVFGKTNLPAYADDFQTFNDIHGVTNNPWDLARTPGGSSGGSAVAVAAGYSALELGSDIGGSIRNPAHFCGIYGHKPSYGIVPFAGHIPPRPEYSLLAPDIAVAGPLARSAEDLTLALEVLAGPSGHDATAWRLELPAPRARRIEDFRVAAWLDDRACSVDQEVGRVLEHMVESLRGAGAGVDLEARPEFDLTTAHDLYLDLLYAVYSPSMSDDRFASYTIDDDEAARQLGPHDRFAGAVSQRHRRWLQSNFVRQKLRETWAEFFKRFDILLCPAAPIVAFPHDHGNPLRERRIIVNGAERPYLDFLKWAGFVGVSYLPATVAPVGSTDAGLPVGVQIVGPYLEDRTPLAFAEALAPICGEFVPPPAFS